MTEIGIDMGISRFATLSNGTYFEPLNIFKQNQLKLKKLQQQLSHKKNLAKTG
jgi:putative transposase